MKRINITIGWINAVGYCLVVGLAVILQAWGLALLSVGGILVAHQLLLKYEQL